MKKSANDYSEVARLFFSKTIQDEIEAQERLEAARKSGDQYAALFSNSYDYRTDKADNEIQEKVKINLGGNEDNSRNFFKHIPGNRPDTGLTPLGARSGLEDIGRAAMNLWARRPEADKNAGTNINNKEDKGKEVVNPQAGTDTNQQQQTAINQDMKVSDKFIVFVKNYEKVAETGNHASSI